MHTKQSRREEKNNEKQDLQYTFDKKNKQTSLMNDETCDLVAKLISNFPFGCVADAQPCTEVYKVDKMCIIVLNAEIVTICTKWINS